MKNFTSTLALLLVTAICLGQKEVPFYGIKLKATDVFGCKGKNCTFTPNGTDVFPKSLNGTIPMEGLYEFLGGVYSTRNFLKPPSKLLNLSTGSEVSVLDSIDFRFYKKDGIEKLDKQFGNEEGYQKFKLEFQGNGRSISWLKTFLLQPQNSKYSSALINSKYKTTLRKDIGYLKTIKSAINIGLTGQIIDSIKSVGGINFTTDNSLKDTVDRKITTSILNVYTIRLEDEYIKSAGRYFQKYWDNPQLRGSLKNSSDDFLADLGDFLPDDKQSVVAYATVLEATLITSKVSNLSRSIGASLEGKLNQTQKETLLPKIEAKISALLSKKVNEDQTVTSNHSFYLLSYGADKRLEVGN